MGRVITAGFWLLALAFAFLVATPIAECQEAATASEEPRLDLRGSGGWAMGDTNNLNTYLNMANNDVEVNNYDFALNVLARPAENITIHAQPSWQSNNAVTGGNDLRIDLAYVEWRFVPSVMIQVGKIKNPMGLYTDIYKIGTLRPFYNLPAAFYRNAPLAYVGGGLSGMKRFGEWELEGHVLGGQMDFDPRPTDLAVVNPSTGVTTYRTVQLDNQARDFVGGGTILSLPQKGLKISLQAFSMRLFAAVSGQPLTAAKDPRTGQAERTTAFAGSVEYLTAHISLRAEGMTVKKPNDFKVGYAEAAYKFDEHWQLAVQYDVLDHTYPAPIVEQLREHKATSVGLNFWVKPNLVWKLSYSHVIGNYLARSADALNDAVAGRLDETTEVLFAGAQFSF